MVDYISIKNFPNNIPIMRLDKNYNNYNKKTISSTGNEMLVHFVTDQEGTAQGFRAKFHYLPIEANCQAWLNMNSQYLMSPDYPTIDCSWVISASMGSTISIQFETFEVYFKCV